MNPIAAIFSDFLLYRYSLVLSLACAASICFFMACCSYLEIPSVRAAFAVLTALLLSFPLSRLIYWYGRPHRFTSFIQALTAPGSETLALIGAFFGCFLAAFLTGGPKYHKKMLDCMSVSGCAGIFLGRLGFFFTAAGRGQIMGPDTGFPWVYPVSNTAGYLEYRFATFLIQAAVAALLGIFVTIVFFRKKTRPGDVMILFLLFYSASQIILDSTRYDSLYLRSNGFISIVQVLAALALVAVLVILIIRAIKILGWKGWMIPFWISLAGLLGGVGFMEYFVQRRGREAAFAYTTMGIYLAGIVSIGLLLWYLTQPYLQEP